MRAVVIHQFGDPKQLKVEDVPTPASAAGEVLVEVKAASINASDVKNVKGHMHGTTLPRIPGRDFAGIVVRGPKELIGREVFGTGGDIGFTRDGSHAQFIALPVDGVTLKPEALYMEAAGMAGVTYVTAWSAMVVTANVERGETVLVIGAAGGVGSAAVQIAAWRGASVIGGVRSDADIAAARENGASDVLNTKSADLLERVRAMTGGRGADVVFDSSGMMFAEAADAAAMHGRIPVISAPADGHASFNLRSIYRKELRVIGIDTRRLDSVACAKLLAEMLPGFESDALKVKPGEPRPLSAAAQAYEEAAAGGRRIVLRPDLG
jgi:NADPH:quinone reductase-like Zn-dependent oxidoreductase